MLLTIVLILFLLAMLYDSATCLRKSKAREKAVYFVLMLISLGILVPFSLDVSMPSPANAIIHALKTLLKLK